MVRHGAIEDVDVLPPLRSHGGDVKWLEMSAEAEKWSLNDLNPESCSIM
jgi:hypothetical protein